MYKLVRDNIPEIIEKSGKKPIYTALDDAAKLYALCNKLVEEAAEVQQALATETFIEVIEELADVYTVFNYILNLSNLTIDEIEKVAVDKTLKNGGFEKGYFLFDVLEEQN